MKGIWTVVGVISVCGAFLWPAATGGESPTDAEAKQQDAPNERTVVESGIELKIAADTEGPAGGPVELTVVLTNRGEKPVYHYHIAYYNDFTFEVKDRKGQPVPFTTFGKGVQGSGWIGSRTTQRLDPGESYSVRFNLARMFDLSMPGKYEVGVGKKMILDPRTGEEMPLKVGGLRITLTEPPLTHTQGPAQEDSAQD